MLNAASDIEFFLDENAAKPIDLPSLKISEWAERRRVLPSGTPFPGFWRNDRTPYLVEIMDSFSPASSVQRVGVMKGTQIGASAAATNICGYHVDEYPVEQLYISASDDDAKKWVAKTLDPMIDSCGFRNKIFSQSGGTKTRRTGDTASYKEYLGGSIDIGSAQNPTSQRRLSKLLLVRDEIDGAPMIVVRTNEGNWLKNSEARTDAFGDRRKILDISTPTTFDESAIYQVYLLGDQRAFMVPCPLCGKHQKLDFGHEKTVHGMKGETVGGVLEDAYYICDHCHDAIFNHHKTSMLAGGYWEPTTRAKLKQFRSYHIPSMYSPAGMLSFYKLYQDYLEAQDTPGGMRSFTNLRLGWPYKQEGTRPKIDHVYELRGDYDVAEVPEGVLYLTAGADVQRGSKRKTGKPARIELEVCGFGTGYRTSSIDYKVFEGSIDSADSGAWAEFTEFLEKGGFKYKRRADGRAFTPVLTFVDSGDGPFTQVVYDYTSMWQAMYPSKGSADLKVQAGEAANVIKIDALKPSFTKAYRKVQVDSGNMLYLFTSNFYKSRHYRNLNKRRRTDTGETPPGFCVFPRDSKVYDEDYFKMLTADERLDDGSFHCPSSRSSEALDCRVMCMAASHVFIDMRVQELRKAAEKLGPVSDERLAQIDAKMVLAMLEKAVGRPQ